MKQPAVFPSYIRTGNGEAQQEQDQAAHSEQHCRAEQTPAARSGELQRKQHGDAAIAGGQPAAGHGETFLAMALGRVIAKRQVNASCSCAGRTDIHN